MGTEPDVVYIVRPGDRNEELRFSLRSLANLPHGRVWVAGYMPKWVGGATAIPVRFVPRRSRWERSAANLAAACAHPEVAERFVLMHDDFFVMKPLADVPVLHRGEVERVAEVYGRRGATTYRGAMLAATKLLNGFGVERPLSYELHAPMVIEKQGMAGVLELVARATNTRVAGHVRTLYGNLAEVGGTESHDFKVSHQEWSEEWAFLSTSDHVFGEGAVGRHIRKRFPEPSRYEG